MGYKTAFFDYYGKSLVMIMTVIGIICIFLFTFEYMQIPLEFNFKVNNSTLKNDRVLSKDTNELMYKQDRQCTYNVNNEARLRNHCCCGKAISRYITYWSVCACLGVRACMWANKRVGVCMRIRAYSLANPARNANAPYCDVICGPSLCTTFFDISQTMRFLEKSYWT